MSALFELASASAVALCCAIVVTSRHHLRARMVAMIVAVGAVVVMSALWTARAAADRQQAARARLTPADRTREEGSPWAGARACRTCHPAAYDSWSQTHHAKMTQLARADTIIAEWEGVSLRYAGRRYHLMRDGDRYLVDMPAFGTTGEREGERMVRPIVMTTGSHHQQLYWLALPGADEPVGEGAELYDELCAGCHGALGVGAEASALRGSDYYAAGIDASLHRHADEGLLSRVPHDDERSALLRQVLRLQRDDKLVQFPFAWLTRDRRWVHEDATFVHPDPTPDDVEPYDEGWSQACDGCHAVGARFSRKGPDHGDAAVADLSISCEACHGPGAAHVRRHQNPLERYAARNDAIGEADIVLPTSLDATRNASVCGRCHSETWPYDEPRARFSPGDELDAHTRVVQYQPPPYPPWLAAAVDEDDELLASGFWRDGTIRIAGRDYNALRISPCHLEGALTCTTCHQMHGADPNDQLRPEARDNRVCVGCHSGIGADVSAHTHHAPESPGSLCYDCHMPRTTLGLLTVMRAHRIDSPSASVSAESGRPNACNLCHLDRTLSEVAGDLARWYGRPPARIAQSDTAAAVEWLVAGDGVQRAVSAWHFGYGPAQLASGDGWQAPLLAHALTDPYPAVRYIAGKSLASLPGFVGFEDDYVALPDERRSIRERALGQWIVPNDARATTLISAHGLEHGRFSALRAQRDDTPVTVNE